MSLLRSRDEERVKVLVGNSELLTLRYMYFIKSHGLMKLFTHYQPSQPPTNSSPACFFVDDYLTVIFREHLHIKALMLDHLQELMEDGEHYGWPVVRAYHASWLQHIEQG